MTSAVRLLVVVAIATAASFALAACTDGTTPDCSGDAAASCVTEVAPSEGGTGGDTGASDTGAEDTGAQDASDTGAPDTGADSSSKDSSADANDGARPADAGGQ
jgi:hypothetical protein